MDLQKYRKLFLEETRAHLDALDQEILRLEDEADAEVVDTIFRRAHSIKGMAASMGYEPIVDIAHALEDLLGKVREGVHDVTRVTVDLLLAGRDGLWHLVEAVETEAALVAPAELIAQLRGRNSAPARPEHGGVAAAAEPEPSVEPPAGTAFNYRIRFSATAALPAARAFQAAKLVESLAMTVSPTPDDLRKGSFDGTLRLALREAFPPDLRTRLEAIPGVEAIEEESAQVADVPTPAPVAEPPAKAQRIEVPSQIRVDTKVLDNFVDMVGELLTVNNQIREISRGLFSEELQQSVESLQRITEDLYQQVLQSRMVPFGLIGDRLPRVVRDLARKLGKDIDFALQGTDVELDRSLIDNLSDPLLHLIRNALDHGLETPAERVASGKPPSGKLAVKATQEESFVHIEIGDDGRGILRDRVLDRAISRNLVRQSDAVGLTDTEVFGLLFRPGFSTADQVSDVSGRGVGLDVVKTAVESIGGEILVRSEAARGTTFSLRIPARVAIIPVFLVRAGEQMFALPIAKVSRARWIDREEVQTVGGRSNVLLEGRAVTYYNLARLIGIQESFFEPDEIMVFQYERGGETMLIGIDQFIEEREVYLKTAPHPLDRVRGLLGLTLVRGVPVYVLDPGMMVWTHV